MVALKLKSLDKKKAMKKPIRSKKYFAPQNEGKEHKCDHPGCEAKGEYRAPKDRRLKEYYWFCLKHVQEYNQKWNYYDGADSEEEEKNRRSRMRFRWFGTKVKYSFGDEFADEYNAFREYANDFSAMNDVYFSDEDRRNLKIMELQNEEEITIEIIKKQYKKLVKKYHPDVNREDKQAEEKFKLLGAAYKAILSKLSK